MIKSKVKHWVLLFVERNIAVYIGSLGIEYILQKVLNKNRDKPITHKTFRIQGNDSIMYGYYCIAFIKYMLARETMLDYTNLFSLIDRKKNKLILKKNMAEEANLEFILIKIDETKNYLLEEIIHNNFRNGKYKKTCKYLNHVKQLLILVLTITRCVSVSLCSCW